VVLVAVLIGWQIFNGMFKATNSRGPNRKNPPVAVEVEPVTEGSIREIGIYTGTLLPQSRFIVAPKIAGRIVKIMVDIGDKVKSGEMISIMDDAEFVQQVDQARAELDVAKANIEENRSELGLKQRELERVRTLRDKKIVSESDLDRAEVEYMAAIAKQKVVFAQVAQKESELKTAQVRLGYTKIKVDWEDAGRIRYVGERYADEGAMLGANTPIVSIIDINRLKAVIHVIERDYPRVRIGRAATITTDAYPDNLPSRKYVTMK